MTARSRSSSLSDRSDDRSNSDEKEAEAEKVQALVEEIKDSEL